MTLSRRKRAAIAFVVVVAVLGIAVIARHAGGPLVAGRDTGAHFAAGLSTVRSFDYFAPPPTASFEGTIERVELVGASPGVRLVGASVQTRSVSDMVRRDLPTSVSYDYCCEPQPLFLLRLAFDDPGPHTIRALGVEYRSGLFSYRTDFSLGDWPSMNPWADPASEAAAGTCAVAARGYAGTVVGSFDTTVGAIRGLNPHPASPALWPDLPPDHAAVLCYIDGQVAMAPPPPASGPLPEPFDRVVMGVVDGTPVMIMAGYRDALPVKAP
jgi:hypothetical protein